MSPDPRRPGTVYRARPRIFRLGRSGALRHPVSPQQTPSSPPDAGSSPPSGQGYPPPPPGKGYPPPPPGQGYPPPPPPGQSYPPPPGQGHPPTLPNRARRLPRLDRSRRRWPFVVVILLVLLVGYPGLLGATAMTNLTRVAAFPTSGRPSTTPGRTYLVVGSDSRQDLTGAERTRLGTGKVDGRRTDTIMLLHIPSGGGPTVLVSIPRDSYVPIPGHGKNKINTAYAFGGPQLLVRTIEQVSGLHIDEYVETGLGGYANLVDAIGGVRICVKRAMNDPKAHINLKAGCQQLDGATALGYARARYSDPRGDLGRVERQREVLAAIGNKILSPSVLAVPWRAFPAARAGGQALTVDDGTSPIAIARFVLAMRTVSGGNGVSLTVPIGANISTPAGAALQWDRAKAVALFEALRRDDTNAVKTLAPRPKAAA